MKIIIDEREPMLYERLLASCVKPVIPLTITKKVIPLGDIILDYDDDNTAVIMERKSLSDLLASIRDGRYKEQSHRLIHSSGISRHNIVYIIEGILNQLSTIDRDLVYATITSLNFYEGFSVIRTSSTQETAEFVKNMAIKIQRNTNCKKYPWNYYDHKIQSPVTTHVSENANVLTTGSYTISTVSLQDIISDSDKVDRITCDQPENDQVTEAPLPEEAGIPLSNAIIETIPPYCSVVKKVKKDNVTQTNIGEIILCQIPGISSVSAVAIMKKFGSIRNLINEVTKDSSCMNDIHTSSTSGTRKIGRNVVTNIRKFLVDDV